MRLYPKFQYRNFDWRNQGNTKSCKVTTIVHKNHFQQHLKKRYRFSLAIVVPQSGSHLHSGDRLFEWPKLSEKKWQMKALRVKFALAHLHKYAFCDVHKYFIILLDGRVLFVSFLPFNDYSTISTIYKTFSNVKLMKKWAVEDRLKFSKLNSFLETSLWRTICRVKNLACIADDRPILSLVYSMK